MIGPQFRLHLWGVETTQVSFARLGIPPGPLQLPLEAAGRAFVAGYRAGLLANYPADVDLAGSTSGFASEGVAMAAAVRDMWSLRRSHFLADVLLRQSRYAHTIVAGAGWGLALAPRTRWKVVLDQLPKDLRELAFDGLGFSDRYFQRRTQRMLQTATVTAYQQGRGRAEWFHSGGDISRLPSPSPDVAAGVGLAYVYVGDDDQNRARELKHWAGPYLRYLQQGACWAATAHLSAGTMQPKSEKSLSGLTGATPEETALLVSIAAQDLRPAPDGTPSYEVWRQRVIERLGA